MNTAIKYGNWAALVNISLMLLFNYTVKSAVAFMGLSSITSLVTEVIFIFLSIWVTRKQLNGEIDFKSAAKAGLTTVLVSTILTSFYIYLHYSYVNPEFVNKFVPEYVAQMKIKKYSEEEIKEQITVLQNSFTPIAAAWQSFIQSLLLETFVVLIIARLFRTVRLTGS